MQVRHLDGQDAEAVAALFARSRSAAMPWLPVLHTGEEDVAFFSGEIQDAVGWGAFEADELLGFAVARPGWLSHLYIAPESQRRGIGSALVSAVHERFPGQLQLWAFARNVAALDFYAHHGAIEVERTDGSGNEEREPDVRLKLPPARPGATAESG